MSTKLWFSALALTVSLSSVFAEERKPTKQEQVNMSRNVAATLIAQVQKRSDTTDGTPLLPRTPPSARVTTAITTYDQCMSACEAKFSSCRSDGLPVSYCASAEMQCVRNCDAKYPH
jgi:hypothetical protein